MSFFDEYADGEGGSQLDRSSNGLKIKWSGQDGGYSFVVDEQKREVPTLTKVICFWNLGGQQLWGGTGPIPQDGDAPLCRNENAALDTAVARPSIQPVTMKVMQDGGFTGKCDTCLLRQFRGDTKPLCQPMSVVYVVDPGADLDEEGAIHTISFSRSAAQKQLREKLKALKEGAAKAGGSYAHFPVTFGKEKLPGKTKGQNYCVPSLSANFNERMSEEWVAKLGVMARIAAEESRRLPSYWVPAVQLTAPVSPSTLALSGEVLDVSEIPF